MKNKIKTFLLFVLVAILGCNFLACARLDDGQEKIDPTKTQLRVSNYDGGYGSEWLEVAIDRFEELYKDYEFEPGTEKKGVQIHIDKNKTTGTTLFGSLDTTNSDIFFTEAVYYYDYVSSGKVLDITDIVNQPLSAYGETRSISDKMNSYQKDFYTTNGKIYMLPHYKSAMFMTYDVDLFDSFNLYFAADVENSDDGFVLSLDDKMSAGPDGEFDTWDDGMPATYDEFFKLCSRMKRFSIIPVSWSGANQQYPNTFFFELMADYEGVDQFMLNFNFSGKATNLISVNNGVITKLPETDITLNNAGYELAKQAGKYYALTFAERLIHGGYYDSDACFSQMTHTQAQKEFLYSSVLNKPKGIFLDGNWWFSEATGTFNTMKSTYGLNYSKENRRLGIMPYPKATLDKVGEKNTFVDFLNSAGFIKASIAENKKEVAKKFLQFCYTDESLDSFTRYTGAAITLDYEVTDDTYKQLSYFGKQYIDFTNNSNIIIPIANNDLYKKNASYFDRHYFCRTKIKGDEYQYISNVFNNFSDVDAEDCFKGMSSIRSQTFWQQLLNK